MTRVWRIGIGGRVSEGIRLMLGVGLMLRVGLLGSIVLLRIVGEGCGVGWMNALLVRFCERVGAR